jgi:hypothetical protein
VPVADLSPDAQGAFKAADGVGELVQVAVGCAEVVQRPGLSVSVGDIAADRNRVLQLADCRGNVAASAVWGTPGKPADPRLPGTARRSAAPAGPAATAAAGNGKPAVSQPEIAPAQARHIEQRLRDSVARIDESFSSRWPASAAEAFLVVARPTRAAGQSDEVRWLADLAARTVCPAHTDEDDADWSVVGPPGAWLAVMTGQANLSAAIRHWQIRYCDPGDSGQNVAQARIYMLAELLGLPSRPNPTAGQPATPEPMAAS